MKCLQSLISPELKLAILLGSSPLSTQQKPLGRKLFKQIDFEHFKQLTDQHHIWTNVYINITEHYIDLLPKNIITYLEKKHQRNIAQSHQQFLAYSELLKIFKTSNIPIYFFKGIPLTKKLYGDLSKRYSKDIDLLIPEKQISLAHTTLVDAGYQCQIYELLPNQKFSLYFKAHKDLTYINQAGIQLELHIRLCPYKTQLSEHYTTHLFETNNTENFSHIELIYLCWHGTLTSFHRLKWLIDIAHYLEKIEFNHASDIDKLIDLAKKLDLLRALTISLVLSNTLYGTQLPNTIKQFYKQDQITRLLTKQALITLNHPKQIHSISFKFEKYFSEILLPQHWTNKFSAVIQKLNPDIIDLLMLPNIPAKLDFLHLILRPATLCYRLITKKLFSPVCGHTKI